MTRHRGLEVLSEAALVEAIARTPIDHFIIWDGATCGVQQGSLRSRALALVDEPRSPMALRTLIQRAARIEGGQGLDPDLVRSAVRLHQSARPAVYLLTRKTLGGEYLAVTDIPWAAASTRPVRPGDPIMDRKGAFVLGEGDISPRRANDQSFARSW